ncbi:MAG: hypothetical protein P8103_10255 [Candidatus Thiodiazotropha sp.]
MSGKRPMNENNKPPHVLSDIALERVMRDVLSGIWEISPDRAQQEISNSNSVKNEGQKESETD